MGAEIQATSYTREQRQRYREKVRRNLDVFEQMLAESHFDVDKPMTGMEIELNLVTDDGRPFMHNAEVLRNIADNDFQTELGRFNIEFNVAPRELGGDTALGLEADLRESLNHAHDRSTEVGGNIVMIGILPTIMPEHYQGEWMSANVRYAALNDAILDARGEDTYLEIEGPTGEELHTFTDSIGPESACTSMQLHLQVAPLEFANYWNAAQLLAGVQLGIGANSPYFYGQRLWAETRIPLFTQAADTRPQELKNQGVRPRVWFGERWITSIFDLFEENVQYFPALLPECADEEPEDVFAAGGVPSLAELKLHNGTVYRWNRPIYDTVGERPHLRVENRVLPAGPTIADVMANAAFYYGALRVLAEDERPVWTKMSFAAARDNFVQGGREGIDARLFWPGRGEIPVHELVLRHLLPAAHEGLARWGVAPQVRDRYLGIIEARCLRETNGASWQVDTVERLQERGLARPEALRQMLLSYAERMHTNTPVHEWELPG